MAWSGRTRADKCKRVRRRPGEALDLGILLHLLLSGFGVRALLDELDLLSLGSSSDARELFMTLTPQVPGRLARTTRPGLAEGMEFLPDTAP